MRKQPTGTRVVKAVRGRRAVSTNDPEYYSKFAEDLRSKYDSVGLMELYGRFIGGYSAFDAFMRRILWRAMASSCGEGVEIEPGVGMRHPETFELGSNIFIGAQAYIQGRHDGCFRVDDHVWIGPGSYFDARDLVLEEHVGWGPGAKVLGSVHTGLPVNVPINSTDLQVKPITVGAWSNIGTNSVLMPGVTIGKGAMVGAGAVVVQDVPAFAKVAGVPARVIGWREGHGPEAEAQ